MIYVRLNLAVAVALALPWSGVAFAGEEVCNQIIRHDLFNEFANIQVGTQSDYQ